MCAHRPGDDRSAADVPAERSMLTWSCSLHQQDERGVGPLYKLRGGPQSRRDNADGLLS
jgi:hypothetical protein